MKENTMKPGEIITLDEDITLNKNSEVKYLKVSNTGDRPIQVGSHYHFFESNKFLSLKENKQKVCD